MKRVLVSILVGVFFLVPTTSWSKDDIDKLEYRVATLEAQVGELMKTVATLQKQLAIETSDRRSADDALTYGLSTESAARQAADGTLTTTVYTEMVTRNDADTKLQSDLSYEIQNRSIGDSDTLVSANTYADTASATAQKNAETYADGLMPDVDDLVPNLGKYVSVDDIANRITFTGVNLQLLDGSGKTYNSSPNGLGNFIIGYDTATTSQTSPSVKTGSHNLVIGDGHTYSASGGFVAGQDNKISNLAATVSGGSGNTASGGYSIVSGGLGNIASGGWSAVSGGFGNAAIGSDSAVSGGASNTASGWQSTVSGGLGNTASGTYDHVP